MYHTHTNTQAFNLDERHPNLTKVAAFCYLFPPLYSIVIKLGTNKVMFMCMTLLCPVH